MNSSHGRDNETWVLILASCFIVFCILAFFAGNIVFFSINHQQKTSYDETHRYWLKLYEAQDFKAQANYDFCISSLEEIPNEFPAYILVQGLREGCYVSLDETWLNEAKQQATNGRLEDAINGVAKIISRPRSQSYQEAAEQIMQWSQQLLMMAKKHFHAATTDDDCKNAINMARTILSGNPLYEEAQTLIRRWQDEWQANHNYRLKADAALKANNFVLAEAEAQKISTHPYWESYKSQLLQRVQERYTSFCDAAVDSLEQGDESKATKLIVKLPDYEPWKTCREQLAEVAQEMKRPPEQSEEVRYDFLVLASLLVLLGLGVLLKEKSA